MAQGKYIWIAESDDWCEPSFLSTMIRAFEKEPGLVVGYVQSYYMVGDNNIQWISKQDTLENITAGRDFVRKHLLHGNAIFNASMAVFKRSAYNGISVNYTQYKFCGDWLFWSEIAKKGKVFISGKVLNYFRNHNADVSGKAYSDGLNYVEELKILFSFFDEKLITKEDFIASLTTKHMRYKLSGIKFSQEVTNKIEHLFYADERTKDFKTQLTKVYSRAVMKQKVMDALKYLKVWS